ncbi:MAG TPA: ElyC/SanA/YdcF family protein [Patescibacteria group bacterium]|nr:ElyC/SanA/YdcF family protein [Patescibacteria group bacterium]
MKKILFLLLAVVSLSGCSLFNKQTHVVIVPGYGVPVKGNPTYEAYIQKVADYVKDEKNKVKVVVFTGGYSVLADTSEAAAMKEYFSTLVNEETLKNQNSTVYTEECSIISWQNISNTKRLLERQGIKTTQITIFGDEQRKDKLLAYVVYQFKNPKDLPKAATELVNTIKNKGLGVDFVGHNFGTKPVTETASSVEELVKVYTSDSGKQELKTRAEQWSSQFKYDVKDNLKKKGCALDL